MKKEILQRVSKYGLNPTRDKFRIFLLPYTKKELSNNAYLLDFT